MLFRPCRQRSLEKLCLFFLANRPIRFTFPCFWVFTISGRKEAAPPDRMVYEMVDILN